MAQALSRIVLAVAALALAAGCAPRGSTGRANVRAAGEAGDADATAVILHFAEDERPDCRYVVIREVATRAGAMSAGFSQRALLRLDREAHDLHGHAIIDLRESIEGGEQVMQGTVVRFTDPDCHR